MAASTRENEGRGFVSAAELANLFAQTPVPTAVLCGHELVFALANPAFIEIVGGRQLLGRPLLEAVPEMQGQGFDALMREVVHTGGPRICREAPVRIERLGEVEESYFTFVFSPLRAPGGAIEGVISTCHDVTEQVRARESLRESEARYHNIFRAVDVSIWEEDFSGVKKALDELAAAGVRDFRAYLREHPAFVKQAIGLVRIVDVNDATLRMFGARDKPEFFAALGNVFVDASTDCFAEELAAIAQGDRIFESEAAMQTLKGERRDVLCTVAFPPSDPEMRHVLVALTDITERRAWEQALRASEERFRHMAEALRDGDRLKDEFLATLSHELRNPLAPLRNSVELLRMTTAAPTAAAHAESASVLDMMDRQVNHLVRLVDDLLEMSRVSRGTFKLRKERVAVAAVVENAIETSRPLIDAAGHTLQVALPEKPLWLHGDPVRLAQILSNLLNNAARYTDPGGSIRLEAKAVGRRLTVSIADNGCGLAPEIVPRLFEMFTRGSDAAGRGQGGLGIGLALARRLTEMHGGEIEARSAGIGQGSEFLVRLPLAGASAAVEPARARAPSPALRRRSILVVDDNVDAAESLAMLLELLGAEVTVAHGGREALEVFAHRPADVVLLDIGMPGMDGYEVARRLRADHAGRDPKIVALTGWGQEDDRRRARAAGFDHHLVKPIDIRGLRALLESLEGRSGARLDAGRRPGLS